MAPLCLDFMSGAVKSYMLLPLDGVMVEWETGTTKVLDLCVHGHLVILEFVLT